MSEPASQRWTSPLHLRFAVTVTRSPFTTVADLTLHQVSAGPTLAGSTGGPIVFLHALGCDLHLWEVVASGFTQRHRVVRYDLRGHGLSDCGPPEPTIDDHVRDLIGLLDRLSLPAVTLVGISVGGMIALATALRWPMRVRRLVLCATAARIRTRESWTERINLVRANGLEPVADMIVGRWVRPEFATREPAVVRGLRNGLTRTPVAGYLAMCATLRDTNLRGQAEGLRVPALVLSGEHDIVVPPAVGRELADILPDAHWTLIKGAAHLPPVEQPAAMIGAISQFLA